MFKYSMLLVFLGPLHSQSVPQKKKKTLNRSEIAPHVCNKRASNCSYLLIESGCYDVNRTTIFDRLSMSLWAENNQRHIKML